MKKRLIICGVILLLLMLGLSGCLDDSNKDTENGENSKVNLFIGKWKTTPYKVYQNGTRCDGIPSNSTFYTNGTMGSEEVIDNEIIWAPYVIENNQICLGKANTTDYYCYEYEFSDNGTQAILWTYYTDPYEEDTYEFVVEMMKVR